ncbi:hypothetical protein [Levilactobacillus bambusae]|nr:hypothetical protein [Levilactobacillus bambusae]
MKYTKREQPRHDKERRDATWEKFKTQQNKLSADRRGKKRS